jgi:hypothetical protein
MGGQHRQLRPYQQGEFDNLCGVYAVLNAIRLVAAPYHHLPRTACVELFSELTCPGAGRDLVRVAITEGLGTRDVARVIDRGAFWLLREYDLHLRVERPFGHRKPASEVGIDRLLAHLDTPRAAAVVSTRIHWSVASRLGQGRLYLFDSHGRAFYRLAPSDKGGLSHPLWLPATFLLSAGLGPSVTAVSDLPGEP